MKTKKNSLIPMYVLGTLIRFWLATSEYQKVIADRIEISTPTNSWRRVTEGLHLASLNIHPYAGDILHEPPMYLEAYGALVAISGIYLHLVFIACDIATACLLYLTAKRYMIQLRNDQKQNHDEYTKNANNVLISDNDFALTPSYIVTAYLFNPYTIFNCVAFTTTVFSNFFLALFLTGLTSGNLLIGTLALAACTSKDLYSVLLISPLILKLSSAKETSKSFAAVFVFITFWILLMWWSRSFYGSWNFLYDTYGFILTVPDLRPNTGLFWYFFTEIFEHFRTFFLHSFQINVALYVIPLSIRFRKDPMLLAVQLLSLIAVFKSYPCVGDVGFVLALLPCWKHLFKYTQQGFLVGCSFYVSTALAPTLWYLWIYSGSANANFYFGVSLAYSITQIFLIIDILFAYVKREFELIYRNVMKIGKGGAKLVLE